MRRFYSDADIQFLRCNYSQRGAQFCADRLKRSPKAINQIAAKLGLKMPHDLVVRLRKIGQERAFENAYKIDIDRFRNIALAEVAYFLGYFWADGHLKIRPAKGGFQYTMAMCIDEKDYLDIRANINRIGEWVVYIKPVNLKTKRPNPIACIQTYNKPLVIYLAGLDLDKKSWLAPTKILSKIPNCFKHYFWRGYMDGDGSWRIDKTSTASFSGSYEQDWKEHEKVLDSLGIRYRTNRYRHKASGNSAIVFSLIEDIYKWGEYIYQGYEQDGIGLKRKYKRWLLAKDKHLKAQEIENLAFSESRDWLDGDDKLVDLIRRHTGKICRRTILRHFNIKRWELDKMIQKLYRQGTISRNVSVGDKPYLIVAA